MVEETFTHQASGAQYTRKADGTCWYKGLQISQREYDRAKAQNERIGAKRMRTIGNYDLVFSDGRSQEVRDMSLEDAYEYAQELAADSKQTVNVWREYSDHWAMLGSVYPDGRIVGITSDDVWELAAAAMGEK